MRAAVCAGYGPPEVIHVEEVGRPAPLATEVLIRVRAASVNPLDAGTLSGRPYLLRLLTGLRRPRSARPGVDVAGVVEAVGESVTRFRPGDEVFGVCVSDPHASGVGVWNHRQGAFAEYVCAPQSTLTAKPPNISFEQAAAVPVAAFTALQGLRDKGHVQPGERVLVNGAAGGVGMFAVQIAKSLGAEVTGVCSTRNLEMVQSIGADHVIDYTQVDFTRGGPRYDLIFDCVGNHSLSATRRALAPSGVCIGAGDLTGRGMLRLVARMIAGQITSRFVSRRVITFLARPDGRDLDTMARLMATGKVTAVIDRCYGLNEVPQAIRFLGGKHARGKVVIAMEGPAPA